MPGKRSAEPRLSRIITIDGRRVAPRVTRIDVARRLDVVVAVTMQRSEVLEHLQRRHIYRPRADLAHAEWTPGYDWMQAEYGKRVTGASGGPLIWMTPIPRADTEILCDSSCGAGLPRCDRLHAFPGHCYLLVRVGRPRCLLFNAVLWELAVHGAYIPRDDADRVAFREELERRNLLSPSHYVIPREWPADLQQKARKSWRRVFELADYDEINPRIAQAAIEKLLPSDVIGAVRGPDRTTDAWWAAYEALAPEHAGLVQTYRQRLEALPPGALR